MANKLAFTLYRKFQNSKIYRLFYLKIIKWGRQFDSVQLLFVSFFLYSRVMEHKFYLIRYVACEILDGER